MAVSLLREIQASVLDAASDLGPILLKLRFLASRLGSTQLEEWVKHESEGYPADVEVPDYRKLPINYRGTWSGPFGSGINNAPIPPYLIEKFAGKGWTEHGMRQSIAVVDDLAKGDGELHVNASDLILLLQGNVYEDYACHSVIGHVPKTAMREIQNVVRNRILELTIQLEKNVPAALDVTLAKSIAAEPSAAEAVTQIFNQTIHGDFTAVTNTGPGAQITLSISKGDAGATVSALVNAGILQKDAKEFTEILASEEPESRERPFGVRAREWLSRNIVKAADGTWKIGVSVATRVLEEAAMRFYGFE